MVTCKHSQASHAVSYKNSIIFNILSYCRKTIILVFKRIEINLTYFVEEANFSKAFVIISVTEMEKKSKKRNSHLGFLENSCIK